MSINEDGTEQPTPLQSKILFVVVTSSASLSLIAGVSLILFLLITKKYQVFRFRLIMSLALSDIISDIAFITGGYIVYKEGWEENYFANQLEMDICHTASTLLQFSLISSFAWTLCIAFVLLRICDKQSTHSVEHYEKYFHLFCWPLGLIFALPEYFLKVQGKAGLWCWVQQKSTMRFFLGYLPLLILATMILVFFILAKRKTMMQKKKIESINNSSNPHLLEKNTNMKEMIQIYTGVLITLFICWAPAIANRVQGYAFHHSVFWLYLLHGLFEPLQGFCNTLTYIIPTIRGIQSSRSQLIKYVKINDEKYGNFLSMYEEER